MVGCCCFICMNSTGDPFTEEVGPRLEIDIQWREVRLRSSTLLGEARVDVHVEHGHVQFVVRNAGALQKLHIDGELSNQKAVGACWIGQIIRNGVRVAQLAKPVHQLVLSWLLIARPVCEGTSWQ